MSKRSAKSVEEKLEVVHLYLEQGKSITTLTEAFGVSDDTIRNWVRKYQKDSMEGLKESPSWKKYRSELKEKAVTDYLAGRGSLSTIVEKYGISNQYVLRGWIKRYNSGKGNSRMKQGRQTTFEEGVEIVTFTIACDKDDQAAIDKYGLSYQQVYSWVRKFEKQGSLRFEDRRGKGLESKPNLTTEEELQLKIKQLEEGNRYLEMENDLLAEACC